MNREEVAADIAAKHERRMDNAQKWIKNSDSVLDARTKLSDAVRALPGVSKDTDTIMDILTLVDTFVIKIGRLPVTP